MWYTKLKYVLYGLCHLLRQDWKYTKTDQEETMKTKIVTIDPDHLDEALLKQAGQVIRKGGLVAFPTETVYGLGGDALNPESSRKIYEAKGRPSDNPLIVHICCWEDLKQIVSRIPEQAKEAARAFWPGPLTMILPKSGRVPAETTGGLETVAVRMPSHETARKLIGYAGGYVAAPSANVSGRPSPTLARYVIEDMDGRIDMIVDGGEVGIGLESTILDLTVSPPQILRPGYVTLEMLERVLGRVDTDTTILSANSTQAPKAPGMKYRHYAPKGELTIVEGGVGVVKDFINKRTLQDKEQGEKTGVIASDEQIDGYKADCVKCVGSREDEVSIGRKLYTILREFDDEGVTRIYSEAFPSDGYGQAIMNRLLKAAGHKVIHLH